jgi:hypothetical protein
MNEVKAMEMLKGARAMQFTIKPEAMKILEDRWSDISPQEGTEDCVCSWCGKMIGRHERDPVWEDHIEYCIGCEICEIAARMWDVRHKAIGKTLELRFHNDCLGAIIEPRRQAAG